MRYRLITYCLLSFLLIVTQNQAPAEVNSISPRVCQPGQKTQLTLHGTELDESLKVVCSLPTVSVSVKNIEPTQAVIELNVPNDAPLGPLGLWMATSRGPLKPRIVMVDDLESVVDNGNNHSLDSAQSIQTLCAVEGVCEVSNSDFYRIAVTEGQRVAFAVLAQQLLSPLDPVLRLFDAEGNTLHEADDDATGPDCRFSYQFASAGEYWLEVHDNRFAAGDYHLRVGDFPIVNHCYPLAIQKGQNATLNFAGQDESLIADRVVNIPVDQIDDTISVAVSMPGGKSSAWLPLLSSQHAQVVEPKPPTNGIVEPLTIPVGISGRLQSPDERDSYGIRGAQGQSIHVASRTRSMGCPTRLQMKLFDDKQTIVAETKVTEADEWSFEFAFPADGVYRLEVSDLLQRGTTGFGYWVEVTLAESFVIEVKADADAREQFAIENDNGACALDLQIKRLGYDGPIDLSLPAGTEGIRILNSQIPANVNEARVYLVADPTWEKDSIEIVRLRATATDNKNLTANVGSHALRRLKEPFVLVPDQWNAGAILLSSVSKTETPFALETSKPLQFARPTKVHSTSLSLKRVNPEFKANVAVLGDGLPTGWNVTGKSENDTVTTSYSRLDSDNGELEQIPLRVFGEFQGRGRIETFNFPVQWIDPVKIILNMPSPLVVGGTSTVFAKIAREGTDPQPIVLTIADIAPGISAPEPITVAADQTQAEINIELAADAPTDIDRTFGVVASSSYEGQEFNVASNTIPVSSVALPNRMEIFPSEIVLDGMTSQQQLIVTGFDDSDSPRDWTRDVRITSANPNIAKVEGNIVYPRSDGKTEIQVEVGEMRRTVPVRVSHAEKKFPVSFESEVLVALSKQGCNAGACHGSPSGKGSFRLSLRAFDKELDELTLIREDFGRRVNTLDPEQSLLLIKPTMKVAHGGGKQLHKDDAAYKILLDWIAEGAAADPVDTPRCVRLEVFPNQKRVLAVSGGGQQLAITAHFGDGTDRDVTHLVDYTSSNSSVATVDNYGLVTPHLQGETVILVRFLEHIESLPLMFVEYSKDFHWKSQPPNNYVDELVNAKLQLLQYLPSDTCSDSEFLRRVYLDLIGILPTVAETKAFLADTESEKRNRLIDHLLKRDEYARFWALKWGDLLKMTSQLVGDEGVYKYHRWVEQSLQNNLPYDEFARELITGSGSTLSNPPANFYRTATDMNECVETISQVFLGARLQCAKCHNHPFERWTQDNYYGLGAFFHRVQRRNTPRPGEMFIYSTFTGEVTQPRTGQTMQPWLPQVGSIPGDDDKDRRLKFAEWLVDAKNPYFARIEANRIWSQLFSRGIVDPIDDFRDSNPPSNGPLLDALAQDFIDSGYDRKHLLRVILNSRTYQASYQTNDFNQADESYFSHQEPRLQTAERLLDAINQSLGLTQTFGTLPVGTKAMQLPAPDLVKVDFLKVFGQPERSTVCACERAEDSNLGMAIELFNGSTIHEKLRDPQNRFRASITAGNSVEATVRELYLSALCRQPTEIELKIAMEHCAAIEDKTAAVEDVCWALFNTDEFLFQH